MPKLVPGLPYEYATIVPSARLLFTAGACPLDETGQVVCPGDTIGQAQRVMDNLFSILELHGSGSEHIVRTTIYVVGDRADLVAAWEVVSSRIAPTRPPSTLLGVVCLGYPDQLVEVDAIASIP